MDLVSNTHGHGGALPVWNWDMVESHKLKKNQQ